MSGTSPEYYTQHTCEALGQAAIVIGHPVQAWDRNPVSHEQIIVAQEAEIASLRAENERLRYDKAPPTTMRCEACGEDVMTSCPKCVRREALGEGKAKENTDG